MKQPSIGSIIALEGFAHEKFVVTKQLAGGMGLVYFLTPLRATAETVVLKTFRETADPLAFKRECEFWISVSAHPNIARARWYGKFLGQPGILADWYPRCVGDVDVRTWSNETLIGFLTGLLSALDFAHAHGHIIHRDIKPANILLDDKNAAKLTDFGIAVFAARANAHVRDTQGRLDHLTDTIADRGMAGTPYFMAPEILMDSAVASVQTDIYSLGVTLYTLLTGQHPYLGRETNSCWRKAPCLEPLRAALADRGVAGKRLFELTVRSIALDPPHRASGYAEMLMLLGRPQNAINVVQQGIDAELNLVRMYRVEGRLPEAGALLNELSRECPDDPRVLNAAGLLSASQNDTGSSNVALRAAVSILSRTEGRVGDMVLIAPAINLANNLIKERKGVEAFQFLKLAWSWLKGREWISDQYSELGWMLAYEGNFQAALEHLCRFAQCKAVTEEILALTVYVAWRSGRFTEMATSLAKTTSGLKITGTLAALCTAIVTGWLDQPTQSRLIAKLEREVPKALAAYEHRAGLPAGAFRPPRVSYSFEFIANCIEFEISGEVRHGTI